MPTMPPDDDPKSDAQPDPDSVAERDLASRSEPGPPPASTPPPGVTGPNHRCDLCGAAMYERHCRIICPRCGYQRDCSDP